MNAAGALENAAGTAVPPALCVLGRAGLRDVTDPSRDALLDIVEELPTS
jgi:hypothetical protein